MKANSSTDSDVPIENHPAFAIEIPKRTARPIGTEDGFLLDILIRNNLPSVNRFESFAVTRLIAFVQALSVDEVRVVLEGPEAEKTVFATTEDTTLNSGVTDVILRCKVSLYISLSQLWAYRISHRRPVHSSLTIAKYDSPDFFSNRITGRNPT